MCFLLAFWSYLMHNWHVHIIFDIWYIIMFWVLVVWINGQKCNFQIRACRIDGGPVHIWTYRPLFSYTSFAQGKHKWVIVNSLKTLKKYKNVQHNIISLNTLTNSIYYTSLTSHWLKLNHMTWNNFNVLWKLTQTGNNPIVPQKGNKLFRKFQNIHKISKF